MGREGQSKRSERIKQEILDTAMEIGIEEGLEALTVRKISDRMDIQQVLYIITLRISKK